MGNAAVKWLALAEIINHNPHSQIQIFKRDGIFCEVGRRKRTYFILSGSVICVWPALEGILGSSNKIADQRSHHRRMQIIRVRTDAGERIVGE